MGILNFGLGKVLRAGGFRTDVQTITDAALTLTGALHADRYLVLDRAAGQALVLPAALGTGMKFTFIVKTTYTGDATIKVASATDFLRGLAFFDGDAAADAAQSFTTANTGTVATESDTIDLFDASQVTGGVSGARVELIDIATAMWHVLYYSAAGGTEVSPFKVTV